MPAQPREWQSPLLHGTPTIALISYVERGDCPIRAPSRHRYDEHAVPSMVGRSDHRPADRPLPKSVEVAASKPMPTSTFSPNSRPERPSQRAHKRSNASGRDAARYGRQGREAAMTGRPGKCIAPTLLLAVLRSTGTFPRRFNDAYRSLETVETDRRPGTVR